MNRLLLPKIKSLPVLWVIAFLVLHFIYWGIHLLYSNVFLVDSHEYLREAQNISSHFNFYCGDLNLPLNPDLFTKRLPLYPLLIMLSHSITFLLVIQSLLSFVSLYLTRKTLLLFGYQPKYDIIFVLLWVLSPSQFIYANMVMSETLLQFILSVMLYVLSSYYYKRDSYVYLLFFNLMLILAALTKPVMYPFVFINLIGMSYWSLRTKKVMPFVIALIPLFFLVTYSFWNYKRTRVFQYSSIQTINKVDYNAYYLLMNLEGKEKATAIIDTIHAKANRIENYAHKTVFLNNEANAILRHHSWDYAKVHIKGFFRFFIDPGRFDIASFILKGDQRSQGFSEKINSPGWVSAIKFLWQDQSIWMFWIVFIIALGNLIKVAGLTLYIFTRNNPWPAKFIFLILLFYLAAITGPVSASRFMLPVMPVFAGAGLLYLSHRGINETTKNDQKLSTK